MAVSAVILNWKRRNNVRRLLTELTAEPLVAQVIVFNNNGSDVLSTDEINGERSKYTLINSSDDLGLMTRFSAVTMCSEEAVLIIDDDNAFKPRELGKLYDQWCREPDVLHGKHGRKPKPDNTYARDVRGDQSCPIVLTRLMIMHRRYGGAFFTALEHFRHLMKDAKPWGNGEDILMSYVVAKETRKLNRVHPVGTVELPAPAAIHGRWGGHVNYRTRLMRACQTWMETGNPPTKPKL